MIGAVAAITLPYILSKIAASATEGSKNNSIDSQLQKFHDENDALDAESSPKKDVTLPDSEEKHVGDVGNKRSVSRKDRFKSNVNSAAHKVLDAYHENAPTLLRGLSTAVDLGSRLPAALLAGGQTEDQKRIYGKNMFTSVGETLSKAKNPFTDTITDIANAIQLRQLQKKYLDNLQTMATDIKKSELSDHELDYLGRIASATGFGGSSSLARSATWDNSMMGGGK